VYVCLDDLSDLVCFGSDLLLFVLFLGWMDGYICVLIVDYMVVSVFGLLDAASMGVWMNDCSFYPSVRLLQYSFLFCLFC
jgi:hypothetical protein